MYVIIPARYGSTRLPAKALADIHGKPLVQRVYECARASSARRVIVATDDSRIADAVAAGGAEICMTAATHPSGTDRIAEAIRKLRIPADEIVVNLQGDEPLMPAALIDAVAQRLAGDARASMATACHALTDEAAFRNPNVTKVVCDEAGYALYFSRAPIPWPRDAGAHSTAFRHIGLYAYRAGFVLEYAGWAPCPIERTESLEQLRALWHGHRIAVVNAATAPGPGVDTADDLARVRDIFAAQRAN